MLEVLCLLLLAVAVNDFIEKSTDKEMIFEGIGRWINGKFEAYGENNPRKVNPWKALYCGYCRQVWVAILLLPLWLAPNFLMPISIIFFAPLLWRIFQKALT